MCGNACKNITSDALLLQAMHIFLFSFMRSLNDLAKSLDDLQSNTFASRFFVPIYGPLCKIFKFHILRLESVVIRHFLLRRKSLIYSQKFTNRAKVTHSECFMASMLFIMGTRQYMSFRWLLTACCIHFNTAPPSANQNGKRFFDNCSFTCSSRQTIHSLKFCSGKRSSSYK